MTKFNPKNLKKSLLLSCMCLGIVSLTACNTYYFDSSVGPEGQTVQAEQVRPHKKAPTKNNKKATVNKRSLKIKLLLSLMIKLKVILLQKLLIRRCRQVS